MGNKASASTFPAENSDAAESSKTASKPEEIGSIETLHAKVNDVFPVPFSGIKFGITNGLSHNFHTTHTITLCNGEQAGYHFGVNYAGHQKISDTEAYPVLQGDLQPNGQVTAQMVHQFTPSLRVQYMAQMKLADIQAQQFMADLKHGKWQSTFSVINPELVNKSVMSGLGTMRQVTQNLALGSMLFCQMDPNIPGGLAGHWSFGGRYSRSKWTSALSVRPTQLSLHSSFHMRFDESLQFAAELESNFQYQTNVAKLGYQFDFPKGVATVKGQIDSTLNVAASVEKKMFPFTFSLCAMGNHTMDRYAVGVGLSLLV